MKRPQSSTSKMPLNGSRFISLLLLVSLPFVAGAQWDEVVKLGASDPAVRDWFGRAISIDGNRVVVGVRNKENGTVQNSGAAYVFERSPDGSWSQTAKLTPDVPLIHRHFGISVSIDGDQLVVGSGGFKGSGSAYVFEYTETDKEWKQVQKLIPSDSTAEDRFGAAVAISGNRVIVGARNNDGNGENAGAAYIFERSGDGSWPENETQRIVSSEIAKGHWFGFSVAIEGDKAIVGAKGNEAAYIFERSDADGQWKEVKKLAPITMATDYSAFGGAVSISENRAIVGESFRSVGTGADYTIDVGAAYIFERSDDGVWGDANQLIPLDAREGHRMGFSVFVDGDTAMVGAVGDDDYGTDGSGIPSGAAYLFERSPTGVWSQTAKVTAPDAKPGDDFGRVAFEGNTFVVGAPRTDDRGDKSGSIYIFTACEGKVEAMTTDAEICPGETVTLNGGGDGVTGHTWDKSVQNGVPFAPNATATYTVTGKDVKGCLSRDSVEVVVYAATAEADNAEVCQGESVTLSGSGTTEYTWDEGVKNGVPFVPNATATYTVTGKDPANGCVDTDSITVVVHPSPSAAFQSDRQTGCLSSVFGLQGVEETADYQWDFGDGNSSELTTPQHRYSDTGRYDITLTVTSDQGCSSTQTQSDYLFVKPSPIADFSFYPKAIDVTDARIQFDNQSTHHTAVEWIFGDSSASSVAEHPEHLYPSSADQTYTITLIAKDEEGCADSLQKTIVSEEKLLVYIPNAFTPDGDGLNDRFTPQFTSGYRPETYSFTIYNRWGNALYETTTANQGWDGTNASGTAVQGGVYTWQVQFKESKSSKRHIKTGVITLLK